jgi:DNA-binding transcriptional regulator/RsmH inhibitor MraZ
MQPGRTPSWNIIAGIEQSAWLEAVQMSSDDRLPLPIPLRRRVNWCSPEASLPLLATTGPDGEVAIRPLSEQQGELAAIKAALENAKPAERAPLALVAMATYCQISLQPDGRLRLSPTLTLHLCGTPGSRVWVGAYGNVITLWSESSWAALRERSSGALRQAVSATRETA